MIRAVTGELDWLLDDLVTRVGEIRRAVILSNDGLVVGASNDITNEDADYMAALAAGLQSLAQAAGERFESGMVRQTIIELENEFIFVIAAGSGTCLTVLTSAETNVGLVAYEMALLVRRVHAHMATPPRPTNPDIATG